MSVFIAAMVRNEHRDIREWVSHHRKVGIEHISLYDDSSRRGYDKEIGDYIKDGYVDITPWPGKYMFRQHAMYCDFCFTRRQWGNNDWGAFIDADEFICLDQHADVQHFMDEYREFAGVILSWVTYGADGHLSRPQPKRPLRDTFVTPVPLARENHNFKTIAKFNDIAFWNDVHRFTPKKDKRLVNTQREIVLDSYQPQVLYGAHIKHYITKSWQEFLERLERGNVTPGIRNLETFFRYNEDLRARQPELLRDLDTSKFPTLAYERDIHEMLELFFSTDIFRRLTEIYDSDMVDDVFETACLRELANFCTFHFSKINNRSPELLATLQQKCHDLIEMQSDFVRSIPRDVKNYRKSVIEAIINTPFHRNVMPAGEM